MTAIAALLCDQGGSILLSADTKISWGAKTTNLGGSKIYDMPLGLYAAVADDVGWSHVFISKLTDELQSVQDDAAAIDKIKLAMRNSGNFVFKWIRAEILKTEVGITDDEYLHDKGLSSRLIKKAEKALNLERLPIEVILAGFTSLRTIFLQTDGMKIMEQTSPGIFYGGSGAEMIHDWLNFRRQNVHFSAQRSFAHLSEALTFAGRLDPFVGSQYGCFLLRKGRKTEQLNLVPQSDRETWAKECVGRVCAKPTDYLDKPEEKLKFEKAFGL